MSEEQRLIVLTENDIARLINGSELQVEVAGKKVVIRQSYLKDTVADMLIRENRVINTVSNSFEY